MGAQTFVDLRGAYAGASPTHSLEFGHRLLREASAGRAPRIVQNIGDACRDFNPADAPS
jgi:hypothetical protein